MILGKEKQGKTVCEKMPREGFSYLFLCEFVSVKIFRYFSPIFSHFNDGNLLLDLSSYSEICQMIYWKRHAIRSTSGKLSISYMKQIGACILRNICCTDDEPKRPKKQRETNKKLKPLTNWSSFFHSKNETKSGKNDRINIEKNISEQKNEHLLLHSGEKRNNLHFWISTLKCLLIQANKKWKKENKRSEREKRQKTR